MEDTKPQPPTGGFQSHESVLNSRSEPLVAASPLSAFYLFRHPGILIAKTSKPESFVARVGFMDGWQPLSPELAKYELLKAVFDFMREPNTQTRENLDQLMDRYKVAFYVAQLPGAETPEAPQFPFPSQ